MHPRLRIHPRRFAVSLVPAALLVPALALVAKAVIEALTPFSYTIHWLETVPLLIVAFAFVIQAAWNEHRPVRSGPPAASPPTDEARLPPSKDATK